jgi:uncharacterized protein (TIGR02145 family)
MKGFTFTKLGRTLLLLTAVVSLGLMGCGGDDNPSGGGGNGNNNSNNGNNNNPGVGSSETVSLGGLKWMKKNLNVETADSWCYWNSADSCKKYGRLYTWAAAKTACQSVGMRLPTYDEWGALVTAAGGSSVAGKKLKSTSGWDWNSSGNISGDGTDGYGFSALPGGGRSGDGGFGGVGEKGYWWTATGGDDMNERYAHLRDMHYDDDYVGGYGYYRSHAFSVRCVMN